MILVIYYPEADSIRLFNLAKDPESAFTYKDMNDGFSGWKTLEIAISYGAEVIGTL